MIARYYEEGEERMRIQALQGIEGVPVGTRVKKIGIPDVGDWVIGRRGNISQILTETEQVFPILVPDNVYGLIDLSMIKPEQMPDQFELYTPENSHTAFHHVRSLLAPIWLTPNFTATLNYADDVYLGKDDRRLLLRRKAKQVKRYLVMDRKLIVPDPFNREYNQVSQSIAESAFAQSLGMRIEEVSE